MTDFDYCKIQLNLRLCAYSLKFPLQLEVEIFDIKSINY
jgi:hypothetical protein